MHFEVNFRHHHHPLTYFEAHVILTQIQCLHSSCHHDFIQLHDSYEIVNTDFQICTNFQREYTSNSNVHFFLLKKKKLNYYVATAYKYLVIQEIKILWENT